MSTEREARLDARMKSTPVSLWTKEMRLAYLKGKTSRIHKTDAGIVHGKPSGDSYR